MMNNSYLTERLAELRMQEIRDEVQRDRLLKEAGLSRTGGLAHLVEALLDLLITKKIELQNHRSTELRQYQPHRSKAA